MSLRRRLLVPILAAIAALVVLLAIRPLATSRALAIWVVLVAAMTLYLLVRQPRGDREPQSRFEATLRARIAPPPAPVELLRMERDIGLGMAGAGHAQHRLIPILREAAAARLGSRHGIELERKPAAARALLGEETWELLRSDRPAPEDRFAPGVPRARVVATIERLESL